MPTHTKLTTAGAEIARRLGLPYRPGTKTVRSWILKGVLNPITQQRAKLRGTWLGSHWIIQGESIDAFVTAIQADALSAPSPEAGRNA